MIHNTNIAKSYQAKTGKQLIPLELDKETDKIKRKTNKNKFKGKQFEKKKRQLERILKKVHGK